MLPKFKHHALATAVALSAVSGHASAAGGHSFELNKVTVAATMTEQTINDVASTVSVISAEDIDNSMSSNIKDQVRYEPGVQVRDSGRFGATGFNIRGADGNQVKILIDGIEQAEAFTPGGGFQQANRIFFDLESLKQIEVVKGPASSLYGSSAIGGVVSLTTKDPSDFLEEGEETALSMKTGFNSADSGKYLTLNAAGKSGDLETLLIYTHRDTAEKETKGTVGGEGDTRSKANPEDNSSDNILAKFQYKLDEANKVEVAIESFKSEIEVNQKNKNEYNDYSAFFGPGAYLEYANARAEDELSRTRISIDHEWQANNEAMDTLTWNLAKQNTRNEHNSYDDVDASALVAMIFRLDEGPRVKAYSHEDESIQFNARADKQIDNILLTYGVNFDETDIENQTNTIYLDDSSPSDEGRYIPTVSARSYGAFAQGQISLNDNTITITPSLRYDNFKTNPKADDRFPLALDKHESDKVSASLGLVANITNEFTAFAQYGQGFKSPDLLTMYFERDGGNYLREANPDLKPEESNSIEIGARFKGSKGDIEISVFHNEYDNYIEEVDRVIDLALPENAKYIPYTEGVTQYQNIAEATIRGAELRSAIWLDELLGVTEGLTLNVAAAYAKGKGKQEGAASGTPLKTISPFNAVISLSYASPDEVWGTALTSTLSENKSKSDLASQDYTPTPGYGVLDLTGFYNVNKDLTLRAGVFNITDKKYWDYQDVYDYDAEARTTASPLDFYSQPGRNFSASVSYKF